MGVEVAVANRRGGRDDAAAERRYRSATTGLANRAGLLRSTVTWLGQRRRDEPTALLFANIEHVAAVNDRYGDEAADRLLRGVAERLAGVLPLGIELAHIEGNQFALLAARHDANAARDLAGRLRAALGAPFEVAGEAVMLDAAVGITHDVSGRISAEALLEQAEVAAYVATAGSDVGRVAVFSERLQSGRLAQVQLEQDLRRAIVRDELSLAYQPVVDLAAGRVSSVEALLRWHHPERGAIPPLAFIPLAESSGLIIPLGAWVARRVCEQLAAWRSEGGALASMGMSVNVSPLQLLDGRLVRDLGAWMAELGVDPALITLELTEEALAAERAEVAQNIGALRGLRVRLAVDDFGGGSVAGELERFAIDHVKLDQSFVRSIGAEGEGRRLEEIVQTAHRLGFAVTAAGVEDPRQLEHLRRLGCEYVQGFLFSEPVTLADVGEAREAAQMRAARLAA